MNYFASKEAADMTPEISMIGLNFIVGLNGTTLSQEEAELLAQLRPAGIILFARNIENTVPEVWVPRLKQLISQAKEASQREDFFVSIDHEGGRVHRFPDPVTHFPPARRWKNKSFEVGCAMGRELRALGFNLSYAPVLDVHAEAANEVIGLRAFADNPEEVVKWSLDYTQGLEAEGILACAKHFPGHGATIADSHLELPRLEASRELIQTRELPPFTSFIKAGAKLLMTAHVLYPCLDQQSPATLSRSILHDLLRKELGFTGCVISDDLEMAALACFAPGDRATKALVAVVDLLLEGYPKDKTPLHVAQEMARGVLSALDKGILPYDILEQSQARIQVLFSSLKKIQGKSQDNQYSIDFLGSPEHKQLCEQLR